MKNIDLDNVRVGAILGILAPLITFISYHKLYYSYWSMSRFIDYLKFGEIFSSVITLCVTSNLALFFIFIMLKKDVAARGVLFSTLVLSGIIMVYKYL